MGTGLHHTLCMLVLFFSSNFGCWRRHAGITQDQLKSRQGRMVVLMKHFYEKPLSTSKRFHQRASSRRSRCTCGAGAMAIRYEDASRFQHVMTLYICGVKNTVTLELCSPVSASTAVCGALISNPALTLATSFSSTCRANPA